MRTILFFLSAVSLVIGRECNCPIPDEYDPKTDSLYTVLFKTTQGSGIGFGKGYTSVEAFIPKLWRDWLIFADGRGHVFNNVRFAANAGLGIRKFIPSRSFIAGANAYYDARQKKNILYQEFGAGVEALFQEWTIRVNGYVPWGPKEKKLPSHRKDTAFYAADVQVGGDIYSDHWFELEGLLGGYYLNGEFNQQGGGGLLRLSAKMTSFVSLEGQTSYDNIFHWRGWGSISFNYRFGNRAKTKTGDCVEEKNLSARFAEFVSRSEIMPLKSIKR